MRRVTAYFLGGTIGMTADAGDGADEGGGAVPTLGPTDLLDSLPLGEVEVEGVELRKVSSASLGFEDLLALLAAASSAVADGSDGIVVVEGTDVLEEVAFGLDALWSHDAPVVFTGAMRHPDLPGPDGPANLAAAVQPAAAPASRGLGVLVVLGEEIHLARDVSKRHTGVPAAFRSDPFGPVGTMLEGAPVIARRVERRAPLAAPERVDARVALMTATFADDPSAYRAVAEASDGMVVAALGAGHVAPAVADALEEAAARMPVVLVSRTGGGSVHHGTYGGPGTEADLVARGLLHGGHLAGPKARVLLALLVAGGADRETVARVVAEHGGP